VTWFPREFSVLPLKSETIFLFDTVRIWEFSSMWTDFDKCHNLSKRNVKLILKVLSDLEPLRGSSNKKNVVFKSFVCKLDLFWHAWAILKREWNGTQTRRINYDYIQSHYKWLSHRSRPCWCSWLCKPHNMSETSIADRWRYWGQWKSVY
jgi:hypothetical protein